MLYIFYINPKNSKYWYSISFGGNGYWWKRERYTFGENGYWWKRERSTFDGNVLRPF
jgi:hypothetical protein